MHIRALLKSGPQILIQPSLGNGVHWSDCRADPIHLRGYAHGHNLASATALQKPSITGPHIGLLLLFQASTDV